ncbi:carbohydrate ABC transporter permease [Bifidobacterium adolescentis]|uniref:carbohydrate ABC transporter permease n=1 Tax=Bifidobacterium adolescentis TaxID=1680 RepID=UPI000E4CC58F|nr:sugar ABC transporter permease [Bifidobacterium adolescentis]RGU87790.1 sugar ABC transporter permease [Bifidobacterium adolescentis]
MTASHVIAKRAGRNPARGAGKTKTAKTGGVGPNRSGRIVPWLFVLPPILWICVFSLGPFINTIRLSFTDSTLLKQGDFIGLQNYFDMFADRRFRTAFLNSSLYVVCIVPFMVILPLMLAALVAEKTRIMNFFRTAFYLPVVMSSVVVGLIWTNLLDSHGLINGVFQALKWITNPIPFLTDRWLLLFSAMCVTIWSGLGYYMIIYLSNIANIDTSLYEAASIDGCSGIQQFFHVTLPGCRFTMVLVMLLSSMSAFRVFGEIYMLSGGTGGIGGADLTMTMLIKQEGTGINARTGYSGALGMVMFVVLGLIVGIEWIIQSRSDKS